MSASVGRQPTPDSTPEQATPAQEAPPSPQVTPAQEAPPTPEVPPAPDVPWLLAPADGLPPVTDDAAGLAAIVARFAAGSGPVALDAERASGYRYFGRAYLIQARRAGAGTALLDPPALGGLESLDAALADCVWVLHAASQDLACLADAGMTPRALFDTELAGRLLGYPRVALGTLVEQLLGVRLEKGHSAADWSTRPLPAAWLVYAALDVELLLPLRDVLLDQLRAAGKLDWAEQEFVATMAAAAAPPKVRAEPWRRLSGVHRLRTPRQLAAARALWEARDERARARDVAPGRVLPDAAIIDAVRAAPTSRAELAALPVYSGPRMRRTADLWWTALRGAADLPDAELPRPVPRGDGDGPPHPSRWADREPAAAARLVAVRATLTDLAAEHVLPVENLLEPVASRAVAWAPPEQLDADGIAAALTAAGARPWQVGLVAKPLAQALQAAASSAT